MVQDKTRSNWKCGTVKLEISTYACTMQPGGAKYLPASSNKHEITDYNDLHLLCSH